MSESLSDQMLRACQNAAACRNVGDEAGAAYWHDQVQILSDRMTLQARTEVLDKDSEPSFSSEQAKPRIDRARVLERGVS